jgi:outer membrane protein assembly factor BamE
MRYFSTLRYLVVLLALLCSACGTALPSIKPYKLDVQQGNVVTSKMLLQLRPGMTKSQVRFIMGTPLIQDSFHGNRWDYVYQMREAGKITEQRRVILDFEKDLLKTVRGDVIPSGSNKSEGADANPNTGTRVVEPYKKPEEKSLINKLKFWEKDDAAQAKSVVEKESVIKDAGAEKKDAGAELSTPMIVPTEAVSDVDASKSVLAVPLEVPVAPSPVANVVDAPVVPIAEERQAATLSNEAVVSRGTDVAGDTLSPKAEPAVVVPPVVDQPVNSPFYDSPSGMLFDRQLRSLIEEELESEVAAEIPSTRVGNKTAPTPKGLPPEKEPSFFDRMLEKIVF